MEDDQTGPGGPTGQGEQPPESLMPYDEWTEAAFRQVMLRALHHVAEHGLPGSHHFYITFRTDAPGVSLPVRLKAQYPQEMTIVLQHQFWDLAVDEADGLMSVGLSFGGVPCTLRIPLGAIVGFADPHVRFGLQFHARLPEPAPEPEIAPGNEPDAESPPAEEPPAPQVVSLDAFRRRTPPKES